jgi:hypothetical protein
MLKDGASDCTKEAGIWCTRKSITGKAARRYLRCCSWWYQVGVKTHTLRRVYEAARPVNLGFSGQVGHLRPAVLETDAVRSAVFGYPVRRRIPILIGVRFKTSAPCSAG